MVDDLLVLRGLLLSHVVHRRPQLLDLLHDFFELGPGVGHGDEEGRGVEDVLADLAVPGEGREEVADSPLEDVSGSGEVVLLDGEDELELRGL